jgi:methyl-accepting chemotaxis protein
MAAIDSLRRSLSYVEETNQSAARFSRDLPRVMEEVNRSIREVSQILNEVKKATSALPRIMEDVKNTTAHTPALAENLKEISIEGKAVMKDVKQITGSVQKGSPQIPDLLASTQETVEDADILIQGLQSHWLLRGSMPQPRGDTSLAISQRESPYENRGETSR